MGLHVRERWKLRQIEESLRRDDPGLDALLAGRTPPGQPAAPSRRAAFRARPAGVLVAGVLLAYLVPPALLAAGLVSHATGLIVAGAIPCPLIPLIGWLLIRRHFIRNRGPSHCSKS